MQLILWRHAEAEINPNNDLARQLTPKGHRQARYAAKQLHKILPKHAQICVSQAVRSQQTAAYLQHRTLCQPKLNPDANPMDLLPLLQPYQDDACVVWVGHQPWIGDLAGFLITGTWSPYGVWIKKGAFWQLDLNRNALIWYAKLRQVVSV